MSCYFRHMKEVLEEAGIQVTKENKKNIDRVIHGVVKVNYKDCSLTWKTVKEYIKNDPKEKTKFIAALKKALRSS